MGSNYTCNMSSHFEKLQGMIMLKFIKSETATLPIFTNS